MRFLIVFLSVLFWSATSAMAQVSVGVGFPGVSIGINLSRYPELIRVPGYPVYYAPGLNTNFFFYDGMYWVYARDAWYASAWYNGPWEYVSPLAVPLFVLRIPVRYYRAPPAYFYGWRPDGPPHWHQHWGHGWEQQRRGWDHWDRRAIPIPAPLPVYQRHYSGNRYPQGMQQQQVHDKNYRYRPRDPEVRQYQSAYAPPRGPASGERERPETPRQNSQRQADGQRAFPPPAPKDRPYGQYPQQPQRSREDARRPEPSSPPPRYREWSGQVPVPQSQARQERPDQRQWRPNQEGGQADRRAPKEPRREQQQQQREHDRPQAHGQERNR